MQIDPRQTSLYSANLYASNSVSSVKAAQAGRSSTTATGPAATTPPQDPVTLSAAGDRLAKAAEERPGSSDPFRAYRDADGNISMPAIMEIEMLPPKLREAGKLVKEAASLQKEIAALQDTQSPDLEKIAALQAEYQSTLSKLQEELEKLGLTAEMSKRGMTIDDVVKGGLKGLTELAEPQTQIGGTTATPSKTTDEKPSLLQRALGAFGRRTDA